MRKFLTAAGVVAILTGMSTFASAAPHDPQVTICHATHSDTNPYVQITVDADAVNGAGHGQDHSGHADDIIPPVEGVTLGLNWDASGQAIYANGCQTATPPTTTPPTTTPPPPPALPEPPVVVPPKVDPPVVVEPDVIEPPVLIPPADTVPPVKVEADVAVRPAELPRTGAGTGWLMALGGALCAAGTLMVRAGRRLA